MKEKFLHVLRMLWYFLIGVICLGLILLYLGDVKTTGLKFAWYQVYLLITVLLLPFFRNMHPNWFSAKYANDNQNKLDQYHNQTAAAAKPGPWSTKGVGVNPYEYSTLYTISYDYGYGFIKALVMSTLFILFAPLFFFVGLKQK